MSQRTNPRAALVAAAIDKAAAHVEPRSATTWSAEFRNGAALAVHIVLDSEWLQLDASIAPPADDLWSMVVRNASLPAGLKLAVGDAGDPPVLLRAEIALEDEVDPTGRVLDACTAIKQVAHVWDYPDDAVSDTDTGAPTALVDIPALCHDSGWPLVERDGRSYVGLDVPCALVQARVEAADNGGIRASVPVGDDGVAPPMRAALALLLLRTSGAVRLVRAAADTAARFEVVLAAPVPAATLAHAFAALSIAYRAAGREAAVLSADETIAETYLRHCGERMGGRPSQ